MSTSQVMSGSSSIAEMNRNVNATGIADVHEIMRKGMARGKSLIYYSQPGVESEIFGLEIAYDTLKRGGNCIFIASSASPDIIKSRFIESGMNIELFEARLVFVDAYSQLIGAPSKEKYIVPVPDNISALSKELMTALKESPPSTVVFGSLSTIMDLCGEKETVEAVRIWNMMAKLCGHALVYNFTAWPYSNEILNCMKKDLFNAVVNVDGMAERVVFPAMLKSEKWMNNNRNICFSGY